MADFGTEEARGNVCPLLQLAMEGHCGIGRTSSALKSILVSACRVGAALLQGRFGAAVDLIMGDGFEDRDGSSGGRDSNNSSSSRGDPGHQQQKAPVREARAAWLERRDPKLGWRSGTPRTRNTFLPFLPHMRRPASPLHAALVVGQACSEELP
eukprot:1137925-Pelagomonas_calceolata.AAC.5